MGEGWKVTAVREAVAAARIGAWAVITVACLLPAACGFAPAYRQEAAAPLAGGAPVAVALEADPELGDAAGELAGDYGLVLVSLSRGEKAEARLTLARSQQRYGLRSDRAATRAAVTVSGVLRGQDADGRSRSRDLIAVVPYDILRSDFASEIARRDAERRALAEVLSQVRATLQRWRREDGNSQTGNN